MDTLYSFSKAAAFGKMLAKSRICEHVTPAFNEKELFVEQVEKITWAYKLSPATINLPASKGVQENQVFHVVLRTDRLSSEVSQTIDKAISSPFLFVLSYKGRCRYVAAYKWPSEADKTKWVVGGYFEADWMSGSLATAGRFVVLNMAALYHFFSQGDHNAPFPAR